LSLPPMLTNFIRNAEAVAYLLLAFALAGDEDCDATDSDARICLRSSYGRGGWRMEGPEGGSRGYL
jgi:hypothetical protein